MTVQNADRLVEYPGPLTGGSPLSVPFPFQDNDQIVVVVSDLTPVEGANEIPFAEGANYNLAGGDPTGTLTTISAVTATQKISIYRLVDVTQLTKYVENDDFPAAAHEAALDKLTYICQQLSDDISRALITPITGPGGTGGGGGGSGISVPAPVAGKFIVGDPTNSFYELSDGPLPPDLPETVVQQQFHSVSGSPQQDFDTTSPTSGDSFLASDPKSFQAFSLEVGVGERRQLLSFENGDFTLPGGNIIRLAGTLGVGGTLSVFRYNELNEAADVVEAAGDGVQLLFDISPISVANQSELEVTEDGVRVPYSDWSIFDANTIQFTVAPTQELAFIPRLGKTGNTGPQGPSGLGDVSGPGSSTVNGIPRYIDASGKTIGDSLATVDGGGNITTPGTVSAVSVNGRDVAADGVKLDGIEALAEANNISDVDATDLTDGGNTSLHQHDDIYFQESEHVNVSAGAGDAGKPIILNANGQVDPSMISLSTLSFLGDWNANTNTPALADGGVGANQNEYYRVGTAGTTSIDGEADWQVDDWIVNTGSSWLKVDNTDKVLSVAGKTGAVTLDAADISDFDTEVSNNTSVAANTAKVSADGSVTSHSDVTDAGSGAIITGVERTKLSGIETAATADQTDGEIKTAYENNADTNAFTDAEQTKLGAIESGATADQSDAEIETAYNNQVDVVLQAEAEAGTSTVVRRWTAERIAQAIAALESPTGSGDVSGPASSVDDRIAAFDGVTGKLIKQTSSVTTATLEADSTKLSGIESGATADQTDGEIKTAYENNANTNAFTDAEQTKLTGIETGATADQSDAEIKTAYENNANTNAFTDAEQTKLSGIEASATADQSNAEIETAYNAQVAAASQAEAEAGTEAAIRRFSPLRVKQAIDALSGGGEHLLARKSADENVLNSITFQDDDHLVLSLSAGKMYKFKVFFFAKEDANNPNIKFQFVAQAGLTINDIVYMARDSNTANQHVIKTALSDPHTFSLGNVYDAYEVEGTIDVNVAGDLRFQWAQDIIDAVDNTTVRMGSYMEAVEIV